VLRRYGCDDAQGYLFARPMAAAAFERWLGGVREKGLAQRTDVLGEA
jgi:EAL domain-containing protein (putative c-di-GMP-specific phosphodiesterase class I)